MKKITAITLFQTAVGYRISMVYSEIDVKGMIIRDNVREDRVLVESEAVSHTEALMQYAQTLIEEI